MIMGMSIVDYYLDGQIAEANTSVISRCNETKIDDLILVYIW